MLKSYNIFRVHKLIEMLETKINKKVVLREAEDSSDDFFQSKHVNKRKGNFEKELDKKVRKTLPKLTKGIEEIKIAYNNKNWSDDKEKMLLELFSKLHVNNKLYKSNYIYGYYLLDSNNKKRCFYDLKSDYFYIDYDSIWRVFKRQFNINYDDIQSFVNNLSKKYFKLYDVTSLPH